MKNMFLAFLLLPYWLSGQQADLIVEEDLSQIAFGSCSQQNKVDDQLWDVVNFMKPNLWIWLGDNVYGDTEDMTKLNADYAKQKAHPDYQTLLNQTRVIGIWDDHDYGVNDGGKEYPMKDGSKKALFNFLELPTEHPAWDREGAYQSYLFKGSLNVKVILLDARYFRDPLKKDEKGWNIPDPEGKVLGDGQWQWLETQLRDESADLFLIGSGIQIIAAEHRFEKWANFPSERDKLFQLISTTVNKPIVLLSGDRHISEVSKIELDGYDYPVYEFTSSSLTNPWSTPKSEDNRFRQKEIVYDPNFAHLSIHSANGRVMLELKYVDKNRKVLQSHSIGF